MSFIRVCVSVVFIRDKKKIPEMAGHMFLCKIFSIHQIKNLFWLSLCKQNNNYNEKHRSVMENVIARVFEEIFK